MIQFLKSLKQDQQGATAVEYGLIVALIFLAIVGAIQTFGEETIEMWNNVSSKVESATED